MLVVGEKNNIVTIKLNRPEIHNAFNDELIEKVTKAFSSIKEETRLVVLTGEGRSFCAGADLNWMKSMVDYSEEENFKDSEKLYEMFETINSCPVPVLGIINGHALGGGMGLVSVCDYALTHEKAKFGFTETRLGLVPAVISSFSLKKMGEAHARSWFLSGERFSAHKAQEMNLITEVSTLDDFDKRADEVINSFMQAGPKASRAAKKLIQGVQKTQNVKAYTCKEIAKLRVSDEGQEGMSALLEKRTVKWMDQ